MRQRCQRVHVQPGFILQSAAAAANCATKSSVESCSRRSLSTTASINASKRSSVIVERSLVSSRASLEKPLSTPAVVTGNWEQFGRACAGHENLSISLDKPQREWLLFLLHTEQVLEVTIATVQLPCLNIVFISIISYVLSGLFYGVVCLVFPTRWRIVCTQCVVIS